MLANAGKQQQLINLTMAEENVNLSEYVQSLALWGPLTFYNRHRSTISERWN